MALSALALAGLLGGGAALGAGGSLAGGFLGQAPENPGNRINPYRTPESNLATMATIFDQLNGIGFGDVSSIPTPLQGLTDQIAALGIDEKTKRRGMLGIAQIAESGQAQASLEPFVDAVLSRVGLSRDDLSETILRTQAFAQQRKRLFDEMGAINEDTVLSRAQANQRLSSLLNQVAGAGETGSLPLSEMFRDQINRNLDQAEQRALLQGQFGGFNPAGLLQPIQRARADSDLNSFLGALGAAQQIIGTVGQGLGGTNASGAGQLATQANQGALSIAAAQAQAANQLQQQNALNNSDSMANGVSGALGSFGNTLSTFGLLGGLGGFGGGTGATAPGT